MKIGKVLFVLAFVLLQQNARASETISRYKCVAKAALGKTRPPKNCSFEIAVDLSNGEVTGLWNSTEVTTQLNQEKKNYAELDFPPEAEASVWQETNSDGTKVWVGMMSPTAESELCDVTCTEIVAP